MFVNHSVIIDLLKPAPIVLQAVQDDSTHVINLQLRENGNTYHVKADASGETIVGVVAYQTAGNVSGEYDTIRGDDAVQVVTSGGTEDDSAWTCYIDGAVFATPGFARVTIRFMTEDGLYLHAFPIDFYVSASGCGIQEPGEHTEMQSLGDILAELNSLKALVQNMPTPYTVYVQFDAQLDPDGSIHSSQMSHTFAQIKAMIDAGQTVCIDWADKSTILNLCQKESRLVAFNFCSFANPSNPTGAYTVVFVQIESDENVYGYFREVS